MAISPAERFGRLEVRMEGVEAAVLNFRNLDKNVSEFMTDFRVSKRADDAFHNLRDEEIKKAALLAAEHVKAELDKSNLSIRRWMMGIAAMACMASIVDVFIHYHVL